MMRVLLVDDEGDFTEILGAFLRKHGFSVEAVNDSGVALARMEGGDFDGVVLDLMMLPVGGLDLLRSLRSLPRHASTPVWVLSAKRLNDEERREMLEFKVQFLTKPVRLNALLQALQKRLS